MTLQKLLLHGLVFVKIQSLLSCWYLCFFCQFLLDDSLVSLRSRRLRISTFVTNLSYRFIPPVVSWVINLLRHHYSWILLVLSCSKCLLYSSGVPLLKILLLLCRVWGKSKAFATWPRFHWVMLLEPRKAGPLEFIQLKCSCVLLSNVLIFIQTEHILSQID